MQLGFAAEHPLCRRGPLQRTVCCRLALTKISAHTTKREHKVLKRQASLVDRPFLGNREPRPFQQPWDDPGGVVPIRPIPGGFPYCSTGAVQRQLPCDFGLLELSRNPSGWCGYFVGAGLSPWSSPLPRNSIRAALKWLTTKAMFEQQ
jgi:hypothetical protein